MTSTDEPLTWEELATLYDKHVSGRRAKTLPMDQVFAWAEKRPDLFRLDENEGTLHLHK